MHFFEIVRENDVHTGNLPWAVTEAEILALFKLSPQVASVELATVPGNPSRKKGFGFLSLPIDHVERVLNYDGSEIQGRTLKG